MKKYFLNIFLLIACFLSQNGYCETSPQEFDNPSLNTVESIQNKIEIPENQVNSPLKSPKNYLDIKVNEQESDRFLSEFMNMLTTLGIIVVIILIATWFLKKMVNSRIQQLNTTSAIKVVERRTLTPKTSLYLLDINGVGFILAESTNGVTSLGSFNVNEIESSQQKSSFNDVMQQKKT